MTKNINNINNINKQYRGPYIKYVGGGPEGFREVHEIFQAYIDTNKCDFIALSQVNEISLTVNEFH